TSTFSGNTMVNQGALFVNGVTASAASVAAGATLGGTGTVGGVVMQGGTLAPGNSIGTLSVAGDVNFSGGGVYEVEVTAAGDSDRIEATGKAILGGGSVLALGQPGSYALATEYGILSAAGGVDGEFGDVTSSLTFLTPELSYEDTEVFLTLLRSDVSFFSVAGT